MINLHDVITSSGILIILLVIASLLLFRAWKQDNKEQFHK